MLKQPQANTQLLLRVLKAIQAPGLRWKEELAFDHCLVWAGKETRRQRQLNADVKQEGSYLFLAVKSLLFTDTSS